MNGRVLSVLSSGFVLLAAGCGQPPPPESAFASPATSNDVLDAPSSGAPTDTAAPEFAPIETDSPVTTIVEAAPGESTAVDPQQTQVDDSVPLGGVTIDDPMPAQADWLTDPFVADAAVRFAYQHWILVDFDKNRRAALVEGGELNAEAIDDGLKAARGVVEFGRIAVDWVDFAAADAATVTFRLQWHDNPSPYFPNEMTGTAVFRDGSWRISGRTLCLLAFGAGQDCAGRGGVAQVAPAALRLNSVPLGFTWFGDPKVIERIPVPGGRSWIGPKGTEVAISTEVLAGVSSLDPADTDVLLASGRYVPGEGTVVTVDGRNGRLSSDGTRLVYVRADDVVVHINATSISPEQLMAFAEALVAA